jgi:hypothetical protein
MGAPLFFILKLHSEHFRILAVFAPHGFDLSFLERKFLCQLVNSLFESKNLFRHFFLLLALFRCWSVHFLLVEIDCGCVSYLLCLGAGCSQLVVALIRIDIFDCVGAFIGLGGDT